jgi:L-ribulose-5-phosphate 3-epimerase
MRDKRHLAPVALVVAALAAVAGEAAAARQGQDRTMRDQIGVFLRSTGRDDPIDALAAVKAVGLDLIQISRLPERYYTPDGTQEFDRMMKAASVRAASVVIVFDGESYRDLDAVETTVGFRPAHLLDARLAYARKCIDFAAALGVKVVTFHMGVLPKDPADPTYRRMLDAVTSITGYAAARGTSISLETGQETGDELARFLDAISVARVGVNFDIANFVLYGMDHPPVALRRLLDRVTSVHVKDGLPPDAPGKLGREVRLGDGRAEVATCVKILRAAGFTGPLVIENYVARASGADPLDELRRAKAFIEKTLAER